MTAATVCAICGAIYPSRDPHTCTYEPHQEGTTMHYPTTAGLDTGEKGTVIPITGERNRHQEIRLACLRLAAETGMPEGQIQQYADRWADFVLGTTKKEN